MTTYASVQRMNGDVAERKSCYKKLKLNVGHTLLTQNPYDTESKKDGPGLRTETVACQLIMHLGYV
jgi:hypothetical protein